MKIKKELKSKYTYTKLIDKTFLEETLPASIREIILLDCQRTSFAHDKLNKQNVLYLLLNNFLHLIGNCKYFESYCHMYSRSKLFSRNELYCKILF